MTKGDAMKRELTITLSLNNGEYSVEIYDGESGDCVSKVVDYDQDEHCEFNEWIGNEIYNWFEMLDEW